MTSTVADQRVRVAGALCLVGTAVIAVAGLHVMLVTPVAGSVGRFGYPYTPAGSQVAHAVYALTHLLLIAGLLGLLWSGALGASRAGRAGVWIAIAGTVGLTACELWAGRLADSIHPSPATNPVDTGFGLSSIALGAGLVVAGVAVTRARVWTGWRRWVVIVAGVGLFVLVTPAMLSGVFVVGRLALLVWNLVIAAMSLALLTRQPVVARPDDHRLAHRG